MIQNQILWTASITPFNELGEIDYNSLRQCLELQNNKNNGIMILGSTGENLSISSQERKKIVEYICSLNLNLNLLIGVPSYNLETAIDWIKFCNEFPINGYLMTTPIYTKPGIMGQTYWFEKLLNTSKLPSMLYNIPSRSGINLHIETINNLKSHDNFVAIKESSGSVENVLNYKKIAPEIAIFCGDDYMMPFMAPVGSCGLVSVASNVWPSAVRKYVNYSLKNKHIEIELWWEACKSLFIASNPIPIKSLMGKLKLISNNNVRLPLSNDDFKSIELLIKYDELINNWDAQN